MKISRLMRCLVCLVLVCCLIVNISPLRAKALTTAASIAIGVVAGSLAVACISNAIGLAAGETADGFNSVVSGCQTFLEEKGWIIDGMVKVGLLTQADGTTRSFFLREMIEDIRSWFHDSGVLSASLPLIPAGSTITGYYGDTYLIDRDCYFVRFLTNTGYKTYLHEYILCPGSYLGYYLNGSDSITYGNGFTFYYGDEYYSFQSHRASFSLGSSYDGPLLSLYSLGEISSSASNFNTVFGEAFMTGKFASGVSTSLDLTLGDIPSPDTSLAEGYADWTIGAVSVPNADTGVDDVYYPVSIPDVYESTGSLTQSGAQAGSISKEMVDSLTGASGGTEEDPDLIGSLTVSATLWSTFTSWLTDHKTAIIDAITAIPEAFSVYFDDVISAIQSIPTAFSTWLERLLAGVESVLEVVRTIPITVAEALSAYFDDVIVAVQSIPTAFSTWLERLLAGVESVLEVVRTIPISVAEALSAYFDDVIVAVQSIPTAFSTWLERLLAGVESVLEVVRAIPATIAEYIAGVLTDAFVISDTYVQAKVEALTLKYPYMETFNVLGADLKSFFSGLGTKPPQIYIHLGNSRGSYNWGGTMLFLDLSWYSEYKPMMDSVLGGFLWLWCGWRTYLSLPGLISGATGVWGAYRHVQERATRHRGKDDDE